MQNNQTLAIAFILSLVVVSSSGAHNLEAQIQVEKIDFVVQAFFEDGTVARDATAEVVASDGQVLAVGKTNEEGKFTFSNDLTDKIEVAVEDDTGHREVFPLSSAAIAMAIKGEAAEMEHTHGEGDHDHAHEHEDEGDHDHGDESDHDHGAEGDQDHGAAEAEHSHDNQPAAKEEKQGLVLTKENSGGSQTNRVISGLGYVLGITGILFYFLGFKQKASA